MRPTPLTIVVRNPGAVRAAIPWWLGTLVAVALFAAQACAPVRLGTSPAVAQPPAGLVLVVSIDGFRYDYLDRFPAPHLRAVAEGGVRAAGLIPVFPSKTLPNHWTLVTGLYPDHHGVIANDMIDPASGDRFKFGRPSELDPRWWGGEPIWNTLQRQGRRTATIAWPGANVAVGGNHPTYSKLYDPKATADGRIDEVMDWLALPRGERPSFVAVYLDDVDMAGHYHGPDSEDMRQAVAHVDRAVGTLMDRLSQAGLLADTDVILLSDHGMSNTPVDRVIYFDDYLDLSTVDIVTQSPVLMVKAKNGDNEAVYRALRGRHPRLHVYRASQLPQRLHFGQNPRVPPVVAIADEGWNIDRRGEAAAANRAKFPGDHGFDPAAPSMKGLFIARGPRVAERRRVPAFVNVNVYDLLCYLAGVEPAPNDGSLRAVPSALFRRRGQSP